MIKTDHRSLRFLLEKHLTIPLHHTWLAKVRGYDYKIVYKKGVENRAVDALSWVQGPEFLTLTLSSVSSNMIHQIKDSWAQHKDCSDLIKALKQRHGPSRFSWNGELLRQKGRLVVGQDEVLRRNILSIFYQSLMREHSGSTTTLERITTLLY